MLHNAIKQEFRVHLVGSGVFIAKNSKTTSLHELVHLLHRFNLFYTKFCVVMKDCQMHPKTMKCTKTRVLGPMGLIGSIRYKKIRCEFVARTFALIAPVQPVLHRVSCSNETIQNTPKHYKTHQ